MDQLVRLIRFEDLCIIIIIIIIIITLTEGFMHLCGLLQARERIVKFLKQKIEQRRFEIGVAHHDVMDLMMKSIDGETLSDAEIIDNLLAGLFAGQDTSATALHWAVYHLSQNPEALEDLRVRTLFLLTTVDFIVRLHRLAL